MQVVKIISGLIVAVGGGLAMLAVAYGSARAYAEQRVVECHFVHQAGDHYDKLCRAYNHGTGAILAGSGGIAVLTAAALLLVVLVGGSMIVHSGEDWGF